VQSRIGIELFRKSKIGKFEYIVFEDEDIAGFDIAMEDALFMQIPKTPRQLTAPSRLLLSTIKQKYEKNEGRVEARKR